MARKPVDPERVVEAVLRGRAERARGRLFTVPPSELMRATGLGPSNLPRILELVSKVCRSNGYRLVRVYARRKSRGYWVEGVEVLPHSRSLLVFAKTGKRGRRKAAAVSATSKPAQRFA
ncbi:MAG: hypothetical protein QXH81_09175 [Thermofilaceae archaeon]